MDAIKVWVYRKKIALDPKIGGLRCGCRRLNLSVLCNEYLYVDFLTEIESIVKKGRDIVTNIRTSIKLTNLLSQKILVNHPKSRVRKLITSNITRWVSHFLMISRFIFLKQDIKEIITDKDISKKYGFSLLKEEDWRQSEVIYIFLKQFYYNNLLIEAGSKHSIHLVTEAHTALFSHCTFFIEKLDVKTEKNDNIRAII